MMIIGVVLLTWVVAALSFDWLWVTHRDAPWWRSVEQGCALAGVGASVASLAAFWAALRNVPPRTWTVAVGLTARHPVMAIAPLALEAVGVGTLVTGLTSTMSKVLLDTNIVLRLLAETDPRHELASGAVAHALRERRKIRPIVPAAPITPPSGAAGLRNSLLARLVPPADVVDASRYDA